MPIRFPQFSQRQVLGLVLIGGVGLFMKMAATPPSPEDLNSPRNAALVCRQFVQARLKAPTTAKFPNVYDNESGVGYALLDSGARVVTAYVDSQNGFGAMIRTPFTCTVTWQHDDTWHLNDLRLGRS